MSLVLAAVARHLVPTHHDSQQKGHVNTRVRYNKAPLHCCGGTAVLGKGAQQSMLH